MVSNTPRPHFTPGKEPVPILQEAGLDPRPVWTGEKPRPHRDSIPDLPAPRQSLYRLSYRTTQTMNVSKFLSSALFRDFTQRGKAFPYRRFGTTFPSHLQGSRSPRLAPIGCPQTSVQNCLFTLRKITEKSRSRIHRSGSLKLDEVHFFIGTFEVTCLARGTAC